MRQGWATRASDTATTGRRQVSGSGVAVGTSVPRACKRKQPWRALVLQQRFWLHWVFRFMRAHARSRHQPWCSCRGRWPSHPPKPSTCCLPRVLTDSPSLSAALVVGPASALPLARALTPAGLRSRGSGSSTFATSIAVSWAYRRPACHISMTERPQHPDRRRRLQHAHVRSSSVARQCRKFHRREEELKGSPGQGGRPDDDAAGERRAAAGSVPVPAMRRCQAPTKNIIQARPSLRPSRSCCKKLKRPKS